MGLCLGFSILSGVEVLHFGTLRAFWKLCRKRAFRKKTQKQEQNQKTDSHLNKLLFQRPTNKVICLNPNTIPVYSNEMFGKGMLIPNGNGIVNSGWGNSQGHHFYNASSFASPYT